MIKHCLIVILSLLSFLSIGQVPPVRKPVDSVALKKDPFYVTVEQSLNAFYDEVANQSNYDSIINALKYESGVTPQFSDEVYCERLEKMNQMTPFHLDCTPPALATIKFFAENRRSFARVVLGRSKLYFEMFEEKLAIYGLPKELKYLAVIESGLRPQVKSRAGALGSWQFMYRTGLYYGLNENSYIDERMDPEKATDAACRYLKKLHDIYGDWNLALASYNAGPGNVNKAIRRSGGKTSYWEVRPFLPLETQGYVPNFIAAAYLLTYHAEHNIIPIEAKWKYAQLDTMCISKGIHMSTISKLTGWDLNEIQTLNPIYKTGYVPTSNPPQCITGPLQEIGKLVSIEDELYALEKKLYSTYEVVEPLAAEPDTIETLKVSGGTTITPSNTDGAFVYHTVLRGETIGRIATKHGVTVSQILTLNNMKSTSLFAGQRIKVKQLGVKPTTETVEVEVSDSTIVKPIIDSTLVKPVVIDTKPVKAPKPKPIIRYYNVRSGDTFSKIAQHHNLTQQQLKRLNPGLNENRLSVGQRIRVK